jgi:hypothetical protein
MPHQQFESCIDACNACATACGHCAAACLAEKDPQQLARCIQLDIDCAEICRVAAGYMSRGSELAGPVCETCAEICDACAKECEHHKAMDHCRQCADACRRCAQECRRMAAAHAGAARGGQRAGVPAH